MLKIRDLLNQNDNSWLQLDDHIFVSSSCAQTLKVEHAKVLLHVLLLQEHHRDQLHIMHPMIIHPHASIYINLQSIMLG